VGYILFQNGLCSFHCRILARFLMCSGACASCAACSCGKHKWDLLSGTLGARFCQGHYNLNPRACLKHCGMQMAFPWQLCYIGTLDHLPYGTHILKHRCVENLWDSIAICGGPCPCWVRRAPTGISDLALTKPPCATSANTQPRGRVCTERCQMMACLGPDRQVDT
jgi:hypothetical protein